MTSARALLERAIVAIDAVNADDPNVVVVDGVDRPKEVVHAERMTYWVGRLAPDASDAQLLAARGHHLRRWVSPRDSYPPGRAGYHRWRADQRERQALEVGQLLTDVGYDPATIERVRTIVAKQGLGRDPDVQTHEDALCLVFLEQQLDPVALQLGDDHTVRVLRRTALKMSSAGRAAAGTIDLSEHGAALLAAALAPLDGPPNA